VQTNNYSVMQQYGTSAFNTVVRWHKLGEVENECTSYNFRLFAMFVSIQKLSELVEIWQSYDKNRFACFFEARCILCLKKCTNFETL